MLLPMKHLVPLDEGEIMGMPSQIHDAVENSCTDMAKPKFMRCIATNHDSAWIAKTTLKRAWSHTLATSLMS